MHSAHHNITTFSNTPVSKTSKKHVSLVLSQQSIDQPWSIIQLISRAHLQHVVTLSAYHRNKCCCRSRLQSLKKAQIFILPSQSKELCRPDHPADLLGRSAAPADIYFAKHTSLCKQCSDHTQLRCMPNETVSGAPNPDSDCPDRILLITKVLTRTILIMRVFPTQYRSRVTVHAAA